MPVLVVPWKGVRNAVPVSDFICEECGKPSKMGAAGEQDRNRWFPGCPGCASQATILKSWSFPWASRSGAFWS